VNDKTRIKRSQPSYSVTWACDDID